MSRWRDLFVAKTGKFRFLEQVHQCFNGWQIFIQTGRQNNLPSKCLHLHWTSCAENAEKLRQYGSRIDDFLQSLSDDGGVLNFDTPGQLSAKRCQFRLVKFQGTD